MVSLSLILATFLLFFIPLTLSLNLNQNVNDTNIMSIDNLNISINSLINITINHSIHLNFFNDTLWNKILQIKHHTQQPKTKTKTNTSNSRHLLATDRFNECPGNDRHCHRQSDGLLHCDSSYISACTSPLAKHCQLPCHNSRYALSPVSMSWSEGVSYCLQHYGSIASIMSSYENSIASQVCPWHCWIGLKEVAAKTYTHWHNGKSISYTNWYPGEPNNDNRHGKDCGELYHEHNGLWNDIPCYIKRLVLCEHGRAQLIGNYIAVQTPKTYIDGDNYCLQKYGTHLATLHSFYDNKQAKKACDSVGKVGSNNEECWIGLKGPFNKWADGVLTRGWMKYSNWYDKQQGNDKTRWRMILRLKDINKGYFKSKLKTDGIENPNDVEANTFSIIGQLNPDTYKSKIDNKYKFKLVYKNKHNSYGVDIIWKQSSWLDAPSIEGFEAISMPGQTSSQCGRFSGLGLSDSHCSYMDGNGKYKGCWWNSVGTICAWNGGIPSYNWQVAKSQTLYVYAPEGSNDLCGVIHSDGKWYDKLCSQKKHFVCNAMSFSERLSPMTRLGLEKAAFNKHFAQWTSYKQMEHMKEIMKKEMEKEEMGPLNEPFTLQQRTQLKQNEEMKKQNKENLRSELQKKGVFEPYIKAGYFSPISLDERFGTDMRSSFPVHWWQGHRRVLIDNEYMNNNKREYYKCVLVSENGLYYDICVGFHGIEIMKYLFYKKKENIYVNGSNDLMGMDKWKYKYILNGNEGRNDIHNGIMVYKFDSEYIYNEIEYKKSFDMGMDERICLNKYICLKLMNNDNILIEMIKINDFDSLLLNFKNDNEWDEIVNRKDLNGNNINSIQKCIFLFHVKMCVESSYDTVDDVYLYNASIKM